ncbi:hypothetical protein ES707_20132 [subsurface metagenome]
MICRKCNRIINRSREPYRGIGTAIFSMTQGYIYPEYEHENCNAPLLPEPRNFEKLCRKLNKELRM